MKRRVGYTLVEVFLVLIIIGLLARLGVPRFREMKLRATATQIVGDVRAVQLAVSTLHVDTNGWPSNGAPGTVPNELVAYLPASFSFATPEYELALNVAPPMSGSPVDNAVVTVDVTSSDPRLLSILALIAQPGLGQYPIGGKYTFVLAGMGSS
ncbi:MAG: hypothetical protein MNPFHGCM_01714 [Gemmatimonadaceae bacterium]|nr:hypothetical protein [Gemmatimonadaceae bacterium]